MRGVTSFVILFLMVATAEATTLANPQAIADPKQILSKPDARVEKNLSIDKLYMTRQVGGASWSPDGKTVAFICNLSGRENLWLVSSDGGWPTQLTVSEQRETSPTWSPDGKWIAYASDYDGDEQWDIFLVSPKTGQVVNLTNTREIAEASPVWSPDGRYLAYMVKPKTSSVWEIDVYDTVLRNVKHITSGTAKDHINFAPLWSADGKFIYYTRAQAKGTNSNIFRVEVETEENTLLTPHEGEKTFEAEDISPDGKNLLVTSNAENGYENVALLEIASKKIRWITEDKWDTSAVRFTPNGQSLTYAANVEGNVDIYFYDVRSGKADVLQLPAGLNFPAGRASSFTRDGSRMLYLHSGPAAPSDLWVYTLADRKSHQLTHSLVGGVRAEDMVEPYLVHYPSKDGKWTISAFVYVPYNLPRNGEHPAIVLVHGGPTSQWMNSFNRFVQYAANQGYLVIAPNYRGSSGYGEEFQRANLFDMGGGDLQDVIAAADWIKQTGYVDPKKVVLMGGSYGGYLTMMGVTKAPDMWAAGVPIVPFVNWFTEIQNEDPLLQQWDLATMGDPVKNKERYEDRSPINFVDQIKAPLYLIAGGNDPRCPKTEAQQMVDAIKKRGGVVEFKVYEDEGHSFARVGNQIDAYKRVTDFLKAHVPPADCGCELNP
ncbi:MAG TPA: S9 family peptidase [Terriglobales bacterium]|nr:S9 family peptidase [Terriglobales bacterium]